MFGQLLSTFNIFTHSWMALEEYWFFSEKLFLQFLLIRYCCNTIFSSSLDLKPRKCVLEIRWHYKPSSTIAWRQIIINFDWKCCFRSSPSRTIFYKRFLFLILSSNQKTGFWGLNYVIMTLKASRQKVRLSKSSFLISDK